MIYFYNSWPGTDFRILCLILDSKYKEDAEHGKK
jgi:hypothetical protein